MANNNSNSVCFAAKDVLDNACLGLVCPEHQTSKAALRKNIWPVISRGKVFPNSTDSPESAKQFAGATRSTCIDWGAMAVGGGGRDGGGGRVCWDGGGGRGCVGAGGTWEQYMTHLPQRQHVAHGHRSCQDYYMSDQDYRKRHALRE